MDGLPKRSKKRLKNDCRPNLSADYFVKVPRKYPCKYLQEAILDLGIESVCKKVWKRNLRILQEAAHTHFTQA